MCSRDDIIELSDSDDEIGHNSPSNISTLPDSTRMCSHDDVIELSDSDEDEIDTTSTAQTTPTTESIRMELIQFIIQMSEKELNAAYSFMMDYIKIEKECQPEQKVQLESIIKVEDTAIASISTEHAFEEVITPAVPLTISQPHIFKRNVPSSTTFDNPDLDIPEDSGEARCRNSAFAGSAANDFSNYDSDTESEFKGFDVETVVKLEPTCNFNLLHSANPFSVALSNMFLSSTPCKIEKIENPDVDSDDTTEFEFCESKPSKPFNLVSSSNEAIIQISTIEEEKTVDRNDKRSLPQEQNSTADIPTSEDMEPLHNNAKRRCLSLENSPPAAGPALTTECADRCARPAIVNTISLKPRANNKKGTAIDNDKQIKCDICGCVTRDLVEHNVREHNSLVNVSRISNYFRSLILGDMIRPILSTGARGQLTYSQYCVFCEKKINRTSNEWVEHLLIHTGENGFKCKRCNMTIASKSHHKMAYKCKDKLIVQRRMGNVPVVGYLCKLCNYVQIFESNMIKHFKQRHFLHKPQLKREYTNIQLVCFRLIKLVPMIKNDRINMYPANPNYEPTCVLCPDRNTVGLIDHYINAHHNAEVYISRISTRMKNLFQSRCRMPFYDNQHLVQAHCPFCEGNWRMSKSAWSLHLTSHTGEQHHSSKLELNCFTGYICNLCNYVQISEKNLLAHLLNQHDVDVAKICENYVKISLLNSILL